MAQLFAKKPESPPRPPLRDSPFPISTARDLLGVARAMWRSALPETEERRELEEAGRKLKTAIDMARVAVLGSDKLERAWRLAEEATEQIDRVYMWRTNSTVVEAACEALVPALARKRKPKDWRR